MLGSRATIVFCSGLLHARVFLTFLSEYLSAIRTEILDCVIHALRDLSSNGQKEEEIPWKETLESLRCYMSIEYVYANQRYS